MKTLGKAECISGRSTSTSAPEDKKKPFASEEKYIIPIDPLSILLDNSLQLASITQRILNNSAASH